MANNTLSEDEAGACCNIIVWDMLISMITSGFAFSRLAQFHWIACVILGIVVGLFVGMLMMVRFLGPIIQLGFSIMWGIELEELLNSIFGIYKYIDKDSAKMWLIRVGVILIIFGLHLVYNMVVTDGRAFFGFIGEGFLKDRIDNRRMNKERSHKDKRQKDKKIKTKKRVLYNERLETEFRETYTYRVKLEDMEERRNKLIDNNAISMEENERIYTVLQTTIDSYNYIIEVKKYYSEHSKVSCKRISSVILDIKSINFRIWSNIKDLEQSLLAIEQRMEERKREEKYQEERRKEEEQREEEDFRKEFENCSDIKKKYKELIKKYHPDNPGGDIEKFKKIQNIYEELCRENEKND